MSHVYALGAVKPWVKDTANEIGNRFDVATIYGVGARETSNSDHPKGLALDFMVGSDLVKGDQISSFLQSNFETYNITYIIWKQHIWNIARASEGWRPMADRGGLTANHFDHVHVSFKATGVKLINNDSGGINLPGGLNIPDPLQGVKDSIVGVQKVGEFITNGHNWLRIGMFVLGFVLIMEALVMFTGLAPMAPGNLAKTATKTLKGAKNG